MKAVTFTIGTTVVVVDEGPGTDHLRKLVTRIIRSGEVEWLPVTGIIDGQNRTIAVLVGPSTPVSIAFESAIDVDDLMGHLVRTYFADEIKEGRAKREQAAGEPD